jgi:hypothetical protein
VGDQGVGIAAPGVQRHSGDAGQPGNRPATKPAVHRGPGAVGHQVQQPATLQVDQAGDMAGRCSAGGLEEAALVQPERGDILQPRGVLHQRAPVVSHRPHDGRPANPQVTSHRRDRVGVLAHPPAGLGPGPLGQHRPGADRIYLLGPGPHPAGRLPAAPDPLGPQEHHRPAADRQVTHPDRAAAMGLGPHATAWAADRRRRGLDCQPPLAARHVRGKDSKPSRPSSLQAKALFR